MTDTVTMPMTTPDGRPVYLDAANGALTAHHPQGCYSDDNPCTTYWGSHGCGLRAGHDGSHVCGATDPDGLCSTDSHWLNDDGTLGDKHSMDTYRRDR
jgi:hypothetical protein